MQNPLSVESIPQLPVLGQQVNSPVSDLLTAREVQMTLGQMAIAKKFPRNTEQAYAQVMQECRRPSLAERAVYAFPRGDKTVSGPSIRLAETLARAWGNLDYGIIELEQRPAKGDKAGESEMLAYCFDAQTNTRRFTKWTVPHTRDTRQGQKKLTDSRDVYEMTANQGARRLRACILAAIPGDIVEAAVEQCEKTLSGAGQGTPIVDRVRAMATAFLDLASVSVEMIEKRLGHNLSATSEAELVQLRAIYTALKDGHSSREDYFDVAATETAQATELNTRQAAPKAVAAPSAPPVEISPPTATTPEKKKPAKKQAVAPPTEPASPAPPVAEEEFPVGGDFASLGTNIQVPPPGQASPPPPAPRAVEPPPAPVQAPTAPEVAAAPTPEGAPRPEDYVFNFGFYTGKKLSELTPDMASKYLVKMNAAPVKDAKINAAIQAVEAYLVNGEAL